MTCQEQGWFKPQSCPHCVLWASCCMLCRTKWNKMGTFSLSACVASRVPPELQPGIPAGWAQPPRAMWTCQREEKNLNQALYPGSPPPGGALGQSHDPMAGSPGGGLSGRWWYAECWCLGYSQHRCQKLLGRVLHDDYGIGCQGQLRRRI